MTALRISDLAQPQLTEAQQGALDATKDMAVDLSVDGILSDARRKTQLDDFGPQDFLRRLQLLCDEWDSDAGLTNIGKLTLRNSLVQYARNRLLIQEVLKQHPEIHDEQIAQPIIVCGLPRSGTTHMLNLLAADSRLRALPLWESYEPVPSPLDKPREDGVDPRYARCQKKWDMTQQMTPLLAAMHPMNPDHIHEELELMNPDF
ncbi:MAG TPA: sulfotransferase, partial [Pseudomonadales bacterium]|nr:sulfotransferase [Pseudomonadales bacterium]